ncbi:hypothetical protein GCM10008098_13230 [Rhodanobacter panaciterrae]|uniref:Uncharacterized protein n=1 Tax=Rhodanobacter panaciterrae TaxID=490572 RepID=A0ABQ2ZSP3_9GAMM|nr:hypothetical protein [Rhodanobacter panaciterrae]GGY21690.1 hypothetical protein GCM10008098_13230 [Rhodanobacter panaciterrae]
MNTQEGPAEQARAVGRRNRPWLLGLGAVVLVAVTVLVTTLAIRGLPNGIVSHGDVPTLTAVQRSALDNAVAAIGKVNAAVEVGVNFPTYGQLLIDAKAATNHVVEVGATPAITNILQETIQNYVDAAKAWQSKVQYPNLKLASVYGDAALLQKYGLIPSNGKKDDGVDPDTAMQKIWGVAGSHYRQLLAAQSGV